MRRDGKEELRDGARARCSRHRGESAREQSCRQPTQETGRGLRGAGQRLLEKLRITVDAAHILRWTSTSSIEADGVVRRIPAGGIVLDHDQMLPRIAKVLLVDKGSRQYWRDIMQVDAGIG